MSQPHPSWTLARRAQRLNPSVIREILKLTERPGIISLAGGLPAPQSFPVQAMREASQRVLADTPHEALQYAASEGFGPLREWVAADLRTHGLQADPAQVLITTGSQQGLDLVGKVLIDAGSRRTSQNPGEGRREKEVEEGRRAAADGRAGIPHPALRKAASAKAGPGRGARSGADV